MFLEGSPSGVIAGHWEPYSENIINVAFVKWNVVSKDVTTIIFIGSKIHSSPSGARRSAHGSTVILDPEGISKLEKTIVHNNVQGSNESIVVNMCEFVEVPMEVFSDALQTWLGRDVGIHCPCIRSEEDCIRGKLESN